MLYFSVVVSYITNFTLCFGNCRNRYLMVFGYILNTVTLNAYKQPFANVIVGLEK